MSGVVLNLSDNLEKEAEANGLLKPEFIESLMEPVNLRAHFDGKQILLDEPFELEPDTELILTILPKSLDDEREDWTRLALENLERAYGNNEPEYSLDLIKEANPEYEGR